MSEPIKARATSKEGKVKIGKHLAENDPRFAEFYREVWKQMGEPAAVTIVEVTHE